MYKLIIEAETAEQLQANLLELSTSLTTEVKNEKQVMKMTKESVDKINEEEAKKSTKKTTKKAKEEVVEDDLDADDSVEEDDEFADEDELTSDSVKDLASAKIKAKLATKEDVKGWITKLGGEKISDLDEKALTKLQNKLNKLS